MKKIKLIWLLQFFILLVTQHSNSTVTQEWASIFNAGSTLDVGVDIATDDSGNSYVLGRKGYANLADVVLIKYNPQGDTVWTRFYNSGTNLQDDPVRIDILNSEIWVSIRAQITINNYDFMTLKFDSDGNLLWSRNFNGITNGMDTPVDLEVDEFGNSYILGNSAGTGTGQDFLVLKYNSAGTQQWFYRHSKTGNDLATDLHVENPDEIYATGETNNTGTATDFMTIKVNTNGLFQWEKFYNGTLNAPDKAFAITGAGGGDVVVTGASLIGIGNQDIATVKYSSLGDLRWTKLYNGPASGFDGGLYVQSDGLNNILVGGYSIGAGTNEDYTLIKYNSAGTQQWVQRFGGAENDYLEGLFVDPDNNIYVTGSTNTNQLDYTTIKYRPDGSVDWNISFNGQIGGPDLAYSIALDNSNNVFITGQSANSGTGDDIVTIKYRQTTQKRLNSTSIVEAFYNDILNQMRSDTVKATLRNSIAPFSIIEQKKTVLNPAGNGLFEFNNAQSNVNYYLTINHRNSIETWSSNFITFTEEMASYDFSNSASAAYGSNQLQVDQSPLKFAMYSGDVNQDGLADLTDIVLINNDANVFEEGYENTDVNGDSFVDVTDVITAYNNSIKFVSAIRP